MKFLSKITRLMLISLLAVIIVTIPILAKSSLYQQETSSGITVLSDRPEKDMLHNK